MWLKRILWNSVLNISQLSSIHVKDQGKDVVQNTQNDVPEIRKEPVISLFRT